MSVEPQSPKDSRSGKKSEPSKARESLNETDLWELDLDAPTPPDTPAKMESSALYDIEPTKIAVSPAVDNVDVVEIVQPTKNVGTIEKAESSQENKASSSLIGYIKSFSMMEKISIALIILVISIAALFSFIHLSKRLLIVPLIPEQLKLPIKGTRFTVTSAETYWRKPVTTGENPDVVRLDTALIPCVRMNIKNGSGAIRVFFYDDQKNLIGDTISRNINGDTEIEISATDGFKDMGMHAEYRAVDSIRWKVHVMEGTTEAAPIGEFNDLFKTHILPDLK